ncbi:LysR family transcriptional regulator [Vibrio aerogenes]|uniref:LysR family transcriptional regulator n=1 Tax=Vibrio aerogenes TaxID=92172 RepID=UPI0039F08BF4
MAALHSLTSPALRYFLEVARCGSISEASLHLNIASSAISRQISALEDQIGTPLFERRSRGMILSASGELLAAYARKVQLETDRVIGEIDALEGLQKGRVTIATTEGFAMEFIPFIIGQYQKIFSGIQFKLDIYSPREVANIIRKGDADIGLAFSLAPSEDIRVLFSQPSPVLAIMHPEHPLAGRKKVSLSQLTAYPLALPYPDTTVRQLFDICTSQQQLNYQMAFVSNYLAALNQFAVNNNGLSLSGEISVRRLVQTGRVRAIPITDKGMGIRNIEVQVLTGRTLPKAVQSFADFLIGHLPPDDVVK